VGLSKFDDEDKIQLSVIPVKDPDKKVRKKTEELNKWMIYVK
jgi:hypothetical protein